MSEAKRARMGVAAPLMWDQFVEENKEDDFFFTGETQPGANITFKDRRSQHVRTVSEQPYPTSAEF